MKAIIKSNDIIAANTAAAGKKEFRPILQGVHIKVEGNRAEVVATDSYRMVVASSEHKDNESGEVTIDVSSLKLKRNELLVIEHCESNEFYANVTVLGGAKTEVKVVQGNYPNYRQLMPDAGTEATPTTHISLSVKYVTELGKAMTSWSTGKAPGLNFELQGPMKPIIATAKDGDRRFFGLVMPVRVSESDCVLGQPKEERADKGKRELEKLLRETESKLAAALESNAKLEKDAEQQEVASNGLEEAEARIEKAEEKIEQIAELVKATRAPELDAKVDALIAEHTAITVAGKTKCAVYLAGIEKGSPEMEAAKAAGARFGNHKRFGKCWYMPA